MIDHLRIRFPFKAHFFAYGAKPIFANFENSVPPTMGKLRATFSRLVQSLQLTDVEASIMAAHKTSREHRPAWSGSLRFGLVTIPVRAYPAKSDKADISLHWLHAPCHNRIRYQKVCPVHGEVPAQEIVSGYKLSRDEYVVIDPDELQK